MTRTARITLRAGTAADVRKLHALIAANQAEGHLLPRTMSEISLHADRFVVAIRLRRLVGCAELAPLSAHVAEVRSLVVDPAARSLGIGGMMVEELRRRARHEGFDRLCAFTHAPGYFMPMGFSIVPHLWLTEKVYTDCVKCPLFRRCGQYAMVLPLESATEHHDRDLLQIARHA